MRVVLGGNDGSGCPEISQGSQRAVRFRIRAGRPRRRSRRRRRSRPGRLPAVPGCRRPAFAARQRHGPRRRPVPPAAVQRSRPVEARRRVPSGHILDQHATDSVCRRRRRYSHRRSSSFQDLLISSRPVSSNRSVNPP